MRLRPQAFLGVRSAGRVRLSDHPRETHPNISSARKYWGPRKCPCRVLRGTGARGPRLRAEKACATSTPGNAHSRNRQVNSSVCAPSSPPRRGFRGSAEPRCLNRLRGWARHPPAHNPRQIARVRKNFLRKAQKPRFSVALTSGACFPGSVCALSPSAYAVLLNKPSTVSVTVFHPRSHLPNRLLPRQVAPPLAG